MADKSWAYYSSAADDEITNRENHAAYHRCVNPPSSSASCASSDSFDFDFCACFVVYGSDPGSCET